MPLLDDLLGRGYLPVQLPPGFSSATFASEAGTFYPQWPRDKPPRTRPETYSVARSSYYRRYTKIVNPIGFYYLAQDIATYWPDIDKHYKKTQLSRSVPVIGSPALRAIQLTQFSELHELKISASAGYRYALVTDLTSFFPGIYTHTLPWALHTKAVAKTKTGPAYRIPPWTGNILDDRSMSLQDGQTIGLPIGPDTSHILAEIIGVAIDEILQQRFGGWPAGFRYVDDFYLFFLRREDAEKALAHITQAVSEFELRIHPGKTRIIEVKELVDESWKYRVKKLSLSPDRKTQRDDIHHFFEALFTFEKRFRDESLVKYGLKRLSSHIIKKSNWTVLEAYLFKCGYSFPNTLEIIARIFTTYNHFGYQIDTVALARFCNTLLRVTTASNHHGEVSWLLWICKTFGLKLDKGLTQDILAMNNSVCTLLALDLYHHGKLTDAPARKALLEFAQPRALREENWLLAYEAGRRKWLKNHDLNFLRGDPYFGPMLTAGVKFYDEKTILMPIFDLIKGSAPPDGFDFDTDQDIRNDFKFDELDEEYFDSRRSGKQNDLDESEEEDEEIDF